MASVGIFRSGGGEGKSGKKPAFDRASAEAWGKSAGRRICNAFAFSSESGWPVLCKTYKSGKAKGRIEFPEKWLEKVPKEHRTPLRQILAQDPRPSYQEEATRVYGLSYAGPEVKFVVADGVLTVCGLENGQGRQNYF